MHLSISQLSELTGRDRRRIAKQLKDLQYTTGEWGAILYGIAEALPLVYAVDNLQSSQPFSLASLRPSLHSGSEWWESLTTDPRFLIQPFARPR